MCTIMIGIVLFQNTMARHNIRKKSFVCLSRINIDEGSAYIRTEVHQSNMRANRPMIDDIISMILQNGVAWFDGRSGEIFDLPRCAE